jgi:hypothetical protein
MGTFRVSGKLKIVESSVIYLKRCEDFCSDTRQARARALWSIRSGQVRSGQVRSGQVRSGQVRSGQVRLGLYSIGTTA